MPGKYDWCPVRLAQRGLGGSLSLSGGLQRSDFLNRTDEFRVADRLTLKPAPAHPLLRLLGMARADEGRRTPAPLHQGPDGADFRWTRSHNPLLAASPFGGANLFAATDAGPLMGTGSARSGLISSMGIGKTIVEFWFEPMSSSVCM
jgi:hypothetical protein